MGIPILIIGESGSGKTSSLRNLPPQEVLVANVERKQLPFKGANQFKQIQIDKYKKFDALLRQIEDGKVGNYKYLIIDSLTSLTEQCEKYTDFAFTGFERWKQYSMLIADIITRLKALNMQVFVLGIPETKDESLGEIRKYFKIKGKELKYGWVEKEFSIVLFTNPIYDDETGEMTNCEFRFKANKFDTSKSPPNMFKLGMSNDLFLVSKYIEKYYG